MPTYGYRCTACSHQFEKFHKITVTSRPKCPRCGKSAERLITGGGGLLFKGSGFYITDYKKTDTGQEKAKADKADKAEKAEKADRTAKADKAEKADKAGSKKPRDEH